MGAGSKPASFASSFAMRFLGATPFIVPPGACSAFRRLIRVLLGGVGCSFSNQERDSSGCTRIEPRNTPGTVKLWESPGKAGGLLWSYSGLRTLFFTMLHENLHSFVQRRRLEHAQMLLADPGLSIKQVAEQMNFSSEFYFSHFFKRLKGMSPRNYREQQRLKR